MIIERPRANVYVGLEKTVKTFLDPKVFEAERNWYIDLPWACPKLFSAKDNVIIMETGQVAVHGDTDILIDLLKRLERNGIHHRDVHPRNLVHTADGLRLIDWETAVITEPGVPSYDLYGPAVSGVAIPKIHRELASGYEMWLGADHPASIKNTWGQQI